MSIEDKQGTSRREFLAATGGVFAGTAVSGLGLPGFHMSNDEEIKVALVGCGGRGSGAAQNAMSAKAGSLKLVAMADAFQDRLTGSYNNLSKSNASKMDVPKERQFVGLDAYKQAMDVLRPGDIVILTTPPAFRWVHFKYAISKKLNVFMEKPVTVDGPTSKRMLKLGEEASAAGLKVGVGLMSRHARNIQELHKRVQDGEIGEILLMRGYRMHGPAGFFNSGPKPANVTDLEYQIRRFHSFIWASGGCFSDFYIHIIDHCAWMKNSWPVKAQALGGRHYRQAEDGSTYVDQNLDTYSVEYTFGDGSTFLFDGRCQNGAEGRYSSYLHGTKGSAIASRSNDCGGPSAIFGDQTLSGESKWQSTDRTNPYQNEWEALVAAIKSNTPYNEVKRGVEASVSTSMGRMAAHTGQVITFDDMLNCEHEMAPGLDTITFDSPAPLQSGSNGRYAVPMPGMNRNREY